MDSLLSNRVYEQLYGAMLDGRLRPGDRLNRRQVSVDLGVSVAPVLEAMTQLEWEGFLETSPRSGTLVREVTLADVLGKFRLRQAIEVEAARVSAGKPIQAARAALESLAQKADRAAFGTIENFRTEVAFHTALVDAARCPQLTRAFGNVMRHGLYHAAQNLLPMLPARKKDIHSRLLAALCTAKADAAEKLIRDHLAPWFEAIAKTDVPAERPEVAFRGPSVSLKQTRRRTKSPRRKPAG
jgi:GntR family transcriptional regulator, rspAB operon transcriptional repressor